MSPKTVRVFSEFLRSAKDWKYGYDIGRNTGLKSGTLYPILMRLAEHALLETRWEDPEPGKPPRHLYRLTAEGLRHARTLARFYGQFVLLCLISFPHLALFRAHSRARGGGGLGLLLLPVCLGQNRDGLQFLLLQAAVDSG